MQGDKQMETELTDQQKMSAGLRELADFLEEHPELASERVATIHKSTWEKDKFLEFAQQLKPFEKDPNDAHYNIFRMFGPIKFEVYCARSLVCTKRMVTKTVEVEEWDCPKILSDNKQDEHEDPEIKASYERMQRAKQGAGIAQDGGIA